jgi:phosphatidylinositol alpha-mannosyltransferase
MIAVSSAPAAHLRPLAGCPLVCLPPCVDLRPYLQRPRPHRDGATLLFLGRLEPRKGVLLLIEAFLRLRSAHPGARLVIGGDGDERAAAERLAAGAVTFAGEIAEADKAGFYAAADVFCAPSPYGESFGLVLAEAMASGLPVVAAANPGYRTVLTGAGAQGLVAPGDAKALAERLSEVLASASLRRDLSAWGRASATQADVNARLEEFLGVYRSKGPASG